MGKTCACPFDLTIEFGLRLLWHRPLKLLRHERECQVSRSNAVHLFDEFSMDDGAPVEKDPDDN